MIISRNRRRRLHAAAAAPAPRPRRRRGMVLLVVISLLALFVLLGVTYTLVASRASDAARTQAKIELLGDNPEKEADLILGQLLYDTLARSSLQHWSLLRDLYGGDHVYNDASDGNLLNDTKVGSVAPAAGNGYQLGGQAFVFQVALAARDDSGGPLSTLENYYSGRVLTFTSGPAAGYSARVMAYNPDAAGGPQFAIDATDAGLRLFSPPLDTDGIDDYFVINGAPFNGAGAGYDSITRNVDAYLAPIGIGTPPISDLVALLPHFAGYDTALSQIYRGGTTPVAVPWNQVALPGGPLWGLNESWDAADIQNMFLAMVPPEAATSGTVPILPSFHRPELVHFWVQYIIAYILQPAGVDQALEQYRVMAQPYGPDGIPGNGDDPPAPDLDQRRRIYNLTRGCIFRPMPWDHPNFTGSNPTFTGAFDATGRIQNAELLYNALVNGPNARIWDVDNDGDGVPDSIWIDPGLPVITSPEGRRYKRLASILIKDLDGRIDPNAHGNLAQVQPEYSSAPTLLGLGTGQNVPRGIGFGPAEVNFMAIVGGSGAYANVLAARHGDSGPGVGGVRDPLSVVKHFGIPNNYAALGLTTPADLSAWYQQQPSWYASPPDVWGRMAVALDYGGQPVMQYGGQNDEMLDSPYELTANRGQHSADNPYRLYELERLLRYHDQDAMGLPSRLLQAASAQLAPGYPTYAAAGSEPPGTIGTSGAHRRREMFGMSSHVPAHATAIPFEFREYLMTNLQKGSGNATILDLYRARLESNGITGALLTAELRKIVPWEIFKGQKFDVNRWLGNGLDRLDTTGVSQFDGRDDPSEASEEQAWVNTTAPTLATLPPTFDGVRAQHTNSVDFNADGALPPVNYGDNMHARQLYARQLFCLAMLTLPDGFQPNFPHEQTLDGMTFDVQRRRLTIRRIAQWAVNVVDFRDSDGIMTPFEFDYNPWDGWHVDGNPATDGTAILPEQGTGLAGIVPQTGTVSPGLLNDRGLVWGMEHPELILNETVAFHDRKVKDTDQAGPGDTRSDATADPDDELDQFAVPEGSLYVELHSTRAPLWANVGQTANQKPQLSLDLHDAQGNLLLGKLAPARPGDNTRWPVWRLAISPILTEPEVATYGTRHPQSMSQNDPTVAGDAYLESASFDPQEVNLIPGGTTAPSGPVAPPERFRFAYFANIGAAPASLPFEELTRSFYNPNNNAAANTNGLPLLQPGQYAVAGPRPITYFGQFDASAGAPPGLWDSTLGYNGYSPQRIEMDPTAVPGTFEVYSTGDGTVGTLQTRQVGTEIRPILPIVLNHTAMPMNWDPANMRTWTQGLNITEPLLNEPDGVTSNFYPEPVQPIVTPGAPADLYDDPTTPTGAADGTGFRDIPVEGNDPANVGRPIYDAGMQETGTHEDVSAVYLQRLANPNLPYNPAPGDLFHPAGHPVQYNPALAINPYVTVDWLSVDVTVFSGYQDTDLTTAAGGPIDPDDDPANRPEMMFRSRQRGYPQSPTQPAPAVPTQANPWTPITQNGALYPPTNPNAALPAPGPFFRYDLSNDVTNVAYDTQVDRQSLGWLNEPVDPQLNGMPYLGEPLNPLPWFTWNNRPFSNAMELLLVPSSSPSRAFSEFTPGPLADESGWATATPPNVYYDAASTNSANFRAPFAHLLNFFHTADATDTTTTIRGAHFCRLLDLVETPSPYVGAERWYNPQNFGTVQGYYRPPFNKLSRFRDPGRININTIFDNQIWSAAVSQFPGLSDQAFANNFVFRSRQGYGTGLYGLTDSGMTPYPTRFANPFRASDSADLMPRVVDPSTGTTLLDLRKQRPVDATLLRPVPEAEASQFGETPLFEQSLPTNQHNNTDRNAYFRYQGLQKLGNVLTTQSNCFAVWITIGYFEVEDNPGGVDAAHPDGLRLGQEIGADSGDVKRHRAFFIIDRSVPVGFIPGQRLNTDECILLRRFIE